MVQKRWIIGLVIGGITVLVFLLQPDEQKEVLRSVKSTTSEVEPALKLPLSEAVSSRIDQQDAIESTADSHSRLTAGYVALDTLTRRGPSTWSEYYIRGRVTRSDNGAPVPDASVGCFRKSRMDDEGIFVAGTTTTREGRYELKLDRLMMCWMRVEAPGLSSAEGFLSIHQPTTVKNFSLFPSESAVTGLVLDPQERPVAGADVIVTYGVSFLDWVPTSVSGRSDREGRFDFSGLPSLGEHESIRPTVYVKADGFLPAHEPTSLEYGQTASVRILLTRALTKSVRVFSLHDRRPVGKVSVVCQEQQGRIYGAETDAQGYARLDLPAETTSIPCRTRSEGYLMTRFEVTADNPLTEVLLEEAVEISGRVLSASDHPVPGALISGGEGLAETDSQGRFSLVPGDLPLTLRVAVPGFLDLEEEIDRSETAGLVTLRLRKSEGAVAGKVVFEGDRRPRRRVNIQVTGDLDGISFSTWGRADPETGEFQFLDLPSGRLELSFIQTTPAGILIPPVRYSVEIRQGQILEGLVVELPLEVRR